MTIRTKEQYAQAFKQLLPRGRLLDYDDGFTVAEFALAMGQIFEDLDDRFEDFIVELYPTTTLELLPDWEREYGLPDDCSKAGDPVEIRRRLLLAKYNALGGQTRAYFIQLALYLGFEITITEFDVFRTNTNATNDLLLGRDYLWRWQINCAAETKIFFKTNLSTTNEPLIYFGNDRLVCFMNKYKPAHTEIIFNFIP